MENMHIFNTDDVRRIEEVCWFLLGRYDVEKSNSPLNEEHMKAVRRLGKCINRLGGTALVEDK